VSTERGQDLWNGRAPQWQHVATPLRPDAEDVRLTEDLVAGVCAAERAPRAALLGVTPELAQMRWPAGTLLVSLDYSIGMIRGVWPARSVTTPAVAVCGDWRAMPLRDRSLDVMVGDGSYNALDCLADYTAMSQEIRRVLRLDGRLVLRFFVRPAEAESSGAVFEDLNAARIGSFHVFKWRLAMALHGDFGTGVRLGDVWDAWNASVPDPVALAHYLDWPLAVVTAIDAYKGADTCYTFPTYDEIRSLLAPFLDEVSCHTPNYEIGDRCPTFVFKPR